MTRLPLPEPKKYFGVDAEPDFTYYTAGQMRDYADAENAALTEQVRVLRAVEPMDAVASKFAHRMALELECVLADRPRYYNKAMQVLGEYRSAMNAIHEQHSPTFMGEPRI